MNKETVNNYKKIFIYFLFFMALYACVIYFNFNLKYLLFNAGLSFIPYLLTSFCVNMKNKGLVCVPITLVAVVFYPNTLYMFTDLIHIRTSEFYSYSGGEMVYVMDYLNWVKLGVTVLLVLISLCLCFESFINILKIIRCYKYKFASFIMLLLFSAISGVALYIGRFLRYNSWNIFDIKEIINYLIYNTTQNDHMLIALFAIMHFIVILLFANLKSH
ncbi:DUF1361 domain-containing protein [Anaerosphaera multitolerans]|uniref:DUF1361 domain-containing protein n=1 Tax=Anaerosphaera multitolerans TaxID=2487351 RepID=A0A437SA60_9FIRM|nr:DUF1361 domain-containing protein [Anaerosphaera multitolerans]RVU55688.1 DUF1361 domain-containing protein [Anaerosphaera multitolerans]